MSCNWKPNLCTANWITTSIAFASFWGNGTPWNRCKYRYGKCLTHAIYCFLMDNWTTWCTGGSWKFGNFLYHCPWLETSDFTKVLRKDSLNKCIYWLKWSVPYCLRIRGDSSLGLSNHLKEWWREAGRLYHPPVFRTASLVSPSEFHKKCSPSSGVFMQPTS